MASPQDIVVFLWSNMVKCSTLVMNWVSEPFSFFSRERLLLLLLASLPVPDSWASIRITTSPFRDALHNHSYTLVCNVLAIPGMNIAPEVTWYHPDGSQVETGGRLTVGSVETTGTTTTLSLTFSPVLHEDGGEYSCSAEVTVPWMTTQPSVKWEQVNMVVTSKCKKLTIKQWLNSYHLICSTSNVSTENGTIDPLFKLGCKWNVQATSYNDNMYVPSQLINQSDFFGRW